MGVASSSEKSFTEMLYGCIGVWVIVLFAPLLLALPSSIYGFYLWRWFAVPYLDVPPLPSIWAAVALNLTATFWVRSSGNFRPLREVHYKNGSWADTAFSELAKLSVFGTAAALHFAKVV